MSHPVFLVHGIGLDTPRLRIGERERRESLVSPPTALHYRVFDQDRAGDQVVVSARGAVVVLQRVGEADDAAAAQAFYGDALFGPAYRRAVTATAEFTGQAIEDLSFSFLWHAAPHSPDVGWSFVRLPIADRDILLEATLIWCLADVVDAAVRRLPMMRAAGDVDREFVGRALELFALERPEQVWTSQREIDVVRRLYSAWGLDERIADLRIRFDQAASGFSFFWEAAERRRDATVTLALSVVAVVGLLQADKQLDRVTGLGTTTVDWIIVVAAASLSVLAIWRSVIAPRFTSRSRASHWRALSRRIGDRS